MKTKDLIKTNLEEAIKKGIRPIYQYENEFFVEKKNEQENCSN